MKRHMTDADIQELLGTIRAHEKLSENDFIVLVSFILGNMVGTYLTVRLGRQRD